MFNVYITELGCEIVWTGGWTATPGNADAWNWYYTNDLVNGRSDPVTYIAGWNPGEPNGVTLGEPAMALVVLIPHWNFVDAPAYFPQLKHCFVCEYP